MHVRRADRSGLPGLRCVRIEAASNGWNERRILRAARATLVELVIDGGCSQAAVDRMLSVVPELIALERVRGRDLGLPWWVSGDRPRLAHDF